MIIKITKEDLINKSSFRKENVEILFEKDNNRFLYLVGHGANVLRIYEDSNLRAMLIYAKDGRIGMDMVTLNGILEKYGFELEG